MSECDWDPQLYLKFQRERDEPFEELVAMLSSPMPDARVIDLGCGDGRLTARLHELLSPRRTVGVDSSEAMLGRSPQRDGLEFVLGDLRQHLRPGSWDLIFSHAALQWIDDQRGLLAQIVGALHPGGQLALQMPANHDLPMHTVAMEVATRPEYAAPLQGYNRVLPVLPVQQYALELAELGLWEQRVMLRVFMHRMQSVGDMAEWARGTFLVPYRQRLDEATFHRYYQDYRQALLAHLGHDGPCWLAFSRILMWARKPEIIA